MPDCQRQEFAEMRLASLLRGDSLGMIHPSEAFQLCYRNQHASTNSREFQLPVCKQVIDRPHAERKSDCGLFAANQKLCVRGHRHFGRRLFPSLPARARRSRLPNRFALCRYNLAVGLRCLETNLVIGPAVKYGGHGLDGIRQLVLRGLIRLQEAF